MGVEYHVGSDIIHVRDDGSLRKVMDKEKRSEERLRTLRKLAARARITSSIFKGMEKSYFKRGCFNSVYPITITTLF